MLHQTSQTDICEILSLKFSVWKFRLHVNRFNSFVCCKSNFGNFLLEDYLNLEKGIPCLDNLIKLRFSKKADLRVLSENPMENSVKFNEPVGIDAKKVTNFAIRTLGLELFDRKYIWKNLIKQVWLELEVERLKKVST